MGRAGAGAAGGARPGEPLPLLAGDHVQAPFRFVLTEVTGDTGVGIGAWHFRHDPTGSLTGVSITSEPVGMDAFADRHTYNSTSPASSFARTVTAQRRHATGAEAMRGCVLTSRDGEATTTRTFEEREEWRAALADVFDLRLAAPEPAIESLWSKVQAAHAEWLATVGRS